MRGSTMEKVMNRKIKYLLISLMIFGFTLVFFGTKSTNELYAQTTPCEEIKYENVCCGPQCTVNGETKNYCVNEGGSYACCFDACDTDPGEN